MSPHSLSGSFLLAVAALFAAPRPAQALLIAIYSQPGDSLDLKDAATIAQAIRLNPSAPVDARFTVKTADSSWLTPEFSVPPEVSAYFWSDHTYEHRGFVMQGIAANFENGIPASSAQADTTHQVPIVASPTWKSEFQGASVVSHALRLRFALSAPGPVTVEAWSLSGQRLGRWNWVETSAGSHEKSLDFNNASSQPALIRWMAGKIASVRTVHPGM